MVKGFVRFWFVYEVSDVWYVICVKSKILPPSFMSFPSKLCDCYYLCKSLWEPYGQQVVIILRCLRLCFMGWYIHHILEYPYTLALACDYLLLELVEELIYYVRPWCSDQKVMPINVHRCLLQTRAVYIITLALHFGCF